MPLLLMLQMAQIHLDYRFSAGYLNDSQKQLFRQLIEQPNLPYEIHKPLENQSMPLWTYKYKRGHPSCLHMVSSLSHTIVESHLQFLKAQHQLQLLQQAVWPY